MTTTCADCGPLGDELEICNAEDEPGVQAFPPAFDRLQALNADLDDGKKDVERVLTCPSCGALFTLRKRTPGGSEDVFRTWNYQTLTRVTARAALVLLEERARALDSWAHLGPGSKEEAARYRRGLGAFRRAHHV